MLQNPLNECHSLVSVSRNSLYIRISFNLFKSFSQCIFFITSFFGSSLHCHSPMIVCILDAELCNASSSFYSIVWHSVLLVIILETLLRICLTDRVSDISVSNISLKLILLFLIWGVFADFSLRRCIMRCRLYAFVWWVYWCYSTP